MVAAILLLPLGAALGGYARPSADPGRCPHAGAPTVVAQLLFGLSVPDGTSVSEAAWRAFADSEIAPRFPDGFTIADAHGQWRDRVSARIAQERTKLLLIAAPESAETYSKLAEIAAAYKTRFAQQSVGSLFSRGCASF